MKIISIIIPVYNVQEYLPRCIESVIQQTYQGLEILLINDGSTDNSGKICDDYKEKDSRIKVIHQQNTGLSGARNTGIDYATGDYIAFVDSDDYISKTMYEGMIKVIEKTNCDICMCSSVIKDENGNILVKEMYPEGQVYNIDEIIKYIVLKLKTPVWNKLYRRELIGNKAFPKGYIHGEDLVFHMKILKQNTKLVTTSKCGYYYIKHKNTITTSKFSEKSFDEVYCKDRAWELLTQKYPQYSMEALVWKFRARMNLIRKMYGSRQGVYKLRMVEYKEWVKNHYKQVKHLLSMKEKIEYGVLVICPTLYTPLVSIKAKRRK